MCQQRVVIDADPGFGKVTYPIYLDQDETVVVPEVHGVVITKFFNSIRNCLDDGISVQLVIVSNRGADGKLCKVSQESKCCPW